MFKKLLIANRGEIALRILRACRELGVETVIAYSEADRDSLPVRLADQRICIGPAQSSKSYLNIPNLISAALLTHCEAIHPGYGFLSENPSFAEVCADCGITFIGPPPAAMVTMGDKVQARRAMAQAGLPMLAGTEVLRSLGEGEEAAAYVGFPLMLKAAAGGGGRGIRLVRRAEEFAHVFTTAQSEVREAFHDDGLYVEKYLGRAKHVEVQVLCDNYGHGVFLGERNCSVQRRHQKLLEESPSPGLPEAVRQDMGTRAVKAVRDIGYQGVGTLEFRVTAEDPNLDFRPQTGTILEYLPPSGPGVRVDSHLYRGYEVPPHYDSLLAKLIVWAPTRDEAIARGKRALNEFVIEGVPTTIPFHLHLLENATFRRGETYTNFLLEHAAELSAKVV